MIQSAQRDVSLRMQNVKLFEGGDLEWDGMIFKEVDDIASLGTVGAASAAVSPVYLVGAQALGLGWAKRWRSITEVFDYQAVRISNHAVESAIRDTSDQSALDAFTYEKDGHSHYVLSGADFTWSYDLTTKSWIERKSYALPRWRACCAARFAGKTIVGDFATNRLYQIDAGTFDENGAPLVMEAHITPTSDASGS